MGLTYWSDRLFLVNEMNDAQYHCAMPLTNLTAITEDMISTAFDGISRMHLGGDSEEDILLGKLIISSINYLYTQVSSSPGQTPRLAGSPIR